MGEERKKERKKMDEQEGDEKEIKKHNFFSRLLIPVPLKPSPQGTVLCRQYRRATTDRKGSLLDRRWGREIEK